MNLPDALNKIDTSSWVTIMLIVAGIFCPGFVALLLHRPDLLESLDFAKLMLLCGGFAFPFVVANVLLGTSLGNNDQNNPNGDLTFTIAYTAMALYGALAMALVFGLTWRWHVAFACMIQALFVLSHWHHHATQVRQGKKSSTSNTST